MRQLLLFLLFAVLPLQSVWAAAAPYCLHEVDRSAKHLGHHEHEHQTEPAAVLADIPGDNHTVPPVTGDSDCAYCHLSCGQPLFKLQPTFIGLPAQTQSAHPPISFDLRDPDLRDKPNWPSLA